MARCFRRWTTPSNQLGYRPNPNPNANPNPNPTPTPNQVDHPLSKQGFEQARSLADKLSALQAASGQTTQEQLQVATLQLCNPAALQPCNPWSRCARLQPHAPTLQPYVSAGAARRADEQGANRARARRGGRCYLRGRRRRARGRGGAPPGLGRAAGAARSRSSKVRKLRPSYVSPDYLTYYLTTSLYRTVQVLCSPLSRAVETCLIALAPLLRRKGLPVTLAPNAREHFRGGGADSLGTATGGPEVRNPNIAPSPSPDPSPSPSPSPNPNPNPSLVKHLTLPYLTLPYLTLP